jgi:hypothetical protein
MTIYITTNHGTGDTYMTLAFAKAVERTRGQPTIVCVPPQHKAVASMFPGASVFYGEPTTDHMLQPNELIVAHPSAVPKRVRIDHLCLLARRLTHADLWRAMLELSPDEPMPRGLVPPGTPASRTVLLLPEARSIPNSAPAFWVALADRLRAEGWSVAENDASWSLAELFDRCAASEWVIGPQCGVMAILCHAMFPCRKTIATPSLDGHSYFKQTYPYMRVTTFSGEDYDDVEEVKVTGDAARAVEEVMSGRHSQMLPVGHGQVFSIYGVMSVGDFLDRYSILELKVENFTPHKRALVMREYLACRDVAETLNAKFSTLGPELWTAYSELVAVNRAAWNHNEASVTGMLRDGVELSEHFALAARHNKDRVRLRNVINALCSSAHLEVKSYYEEGTR